MIGAGAAVLARRFLRAYRDANPDADLAHLEWYAALHSTRLLIDLAMWERDGDQRAATHPWRIVAPGAARAVRRATGIEVTGPPAGPMN